MYIVYKVPIYIYIYVVCDHTHIYIYIYVYRRTIHNRSSCSFYVPGRRCSFSQGWSVMRPRRCSLWDALCRRRSVVPSSDGGLDGWKMLETTLLFSYLTGYLQNTDWDIWIFSAIIWKHDWDNWKRWRFGWLKYMLNICNIKHGNLTMIGIRMIRTMKQFAVEKTNVIFDHFSWIDVGT